MLYREILAPHADILCLQVYGYFSIFSKFWQDVGSRSSRETFTSSRKGRICSSLCLRSRQKTRVSCRIQENPVLFACYQIGQLRRRGDTSWRWYPCTSWAQLSNKKYRVLSSAQRPSLRRSGCCSGHNSSVLASKVCTQDTQGVYTHPYMNRYTYERARSALFSSYRCELTKLQGRVVF
jgi:hypothetical protein